MKVFYSMDDCLGYLKEGALAIGNFDGVHLGHQALIKKTCALRGSARAGILTFTPHPQQLLHKEALHFCLSSLEQKIDIFSRLGLDAAIFHPIDHEFLLQKPEQFASDIAEKIEMRHVVVGEDFTFGYQAMGNPELLHRLGLGSNFLTHEQIKIGISGTPCSSSAIRRYLQHGDIEAASSLLGRCFSLRGQVIVGQKRGRLLGFPTANLKPENFCLKSGVYASITRIHSFENMRDEPSITNVGVRPTISHDDTLVVESHLFDGAFDLYGENIEVFFVKRIRDEERFSSVEALKDQIAKDCQIVRQIHNEERDDNRAK